MTQGRKISDDELVEISGGMDSEVDFDRFSDIQRSPSTTPSPGRPAPGGSPDLETDNTGSGGDSDLGPTG